MEGISFLRIFGGVAAIILIIFCSLGLRSYNRNRFSIVFLFLIGIGTGLISAFPGLMTIPAELLSLGNVKGGRLITLIIFVSIINTLLIIRLRMNNLRNARTIENLLRNDAKRSFYKELDQRLPPDALWVIIPVLNEADNLSIVLPQIPTSIGNMPVITLVVDDGSSDESPDIAHSHGALVAKLPINCGGGIALRTGFQIAMENHAILVITIDGDGQHDPSEISRVISPILIDEADIVIGSRILGSYKHVSLIRSIGIHFYNNVINLLAGTHITDCSSGFRAIRLKNLRSMTLIQEQYHTAELIIEAAKCNMKIVEVPIHIRERFSGTTKKGRNSFYGLMFLRTIIKTWLR